MADHTNDHNTHVVHERVERTGGGGAGLAFILGGVVVVLALLVWLFTGGDFFAGDGGADIEINAEVPAVTEIVPEGGATTGN